MNNFAKTMPKLQIKNIKNKEAGFSLIESAVALAILGTVLAYAAPVFLFAKLSNNKDEIRSGALAVSQKIFDKNRGKQFDQVGRDSSLNVIAEEDIEEQAGGREYIAKVYHCRAIVGADPCDANYKRINIEIKDKKTDRIVYDVEAGLTSFQ
jgi:prepilin-type N-terminal cleavage/methylation domain-containing protein